MGFCVLHYDKQTGSSPGLSQHIERGCYRDGEWVEWHPTNVDPTRTHLNRELMSGELSRDERIAKRIKDAGIKKPRKDQVRALTLIMSASCEDMQRIMDDGNLDGWCEDSIRWAQETHGAENVVSAVLHMDEKTPHLHVTVVPIVQGISKDQAYREKKAKEAEAAGIEVKKKRKYTKKDPDAPRLCAADVMARMKLKEYQTTYAEAMEPYGLRRGVDGSLAKHVDINDWYKQLVLDVQDLEVQIRSKKQEQAELQKRNAKLEKQTQDLTDRISLVEGRLMERTAELKESHESIIDKSRSTLREALGMNKSQKQIQAEKNAQNDHQLIEYHRRACEAEAEAEARYLPIVNDLSTRLKDSIEEISRLNDRLDKQSDYRECKRKAKDYDRLDAVCRDLTDKSGMLEAAVDAAVIHGLPAEAVRPLASGKQYNYTGELQCGEHRIFGKWPLVLQKIGDYIALKCHMGWYREQRDRPSVSFYPIDKAVEFIKRHWTEWQEHWNKRENDLNQDRHRKGGLGM